MEFWKNREMRCAGFHRTAGFWTVFQQKDVAQPWALRGLKCPFTISRPQVGRITDGFFGPIIEIIAERRADLRLELDDGQQLTIDDGDQIPVFLRSKVTWQFTSRLQMDGDIGDSRFHQKSTTEFDEAIQMLATGDGCPLTSIALTCGCPLPSRLIVTDLPEVFDGRGHAPFQVTHGRSPWTARGAMSSF